MERERVRERQRDERIGTDPDPGEGAGEPVGAPVERREGERLAAEHEGGPIGLARGVPGDGGGAGDRGHGRRSLWKAEAGRQP